VTALAAVDAQRRDPHAGLLLLARELGLELERKNAWTLRRKYGDEGARQYLRDLRRVMDAAATVGMPMTKAAAAARIRWSGGPDAAIARIGQVQQRRRSRSTHTCRRRGPAPRDRVERQNALAGCHCRTCIADLVEDLGAYTGTVAARYAPYDMEPEDAEGEAMVALLTAIDTWPGRDSFAAFYAFKVRDHFAGVRARASVQRRQAAVESLDKPLRAGEAWTLADTIPDRSIDVVTIVILRDRLARRIERAMAHRDRALRRFARPRHRRAPVPDRGAA